MIQLHSLADPIERDIALSPEDALDACVEAREQGLVRFIGVTGHGSQIAATHLRSLEPFDFDTVVLPYSYIAMRDSHYAAAFNRQLRERVEAISVAIGPETDRRASRNSSFPDRSR